MSDLLIEIGSEEIPARMVEDLARQLGRNLDRGLREAHLLEDEGDAEVLWTPRRLIVKRAGVRAVQPNREEEVVGPPVRVGVAPDGSFTPQAVGFASKFGGGASDLYTIRTPKGEYVALKRKEAGRPAAELLRTIVPQALTGVDLPRSMKWDETGLRFIRPLRWVMVLLGGEAIEVNVGALASGRTTRGHRSLGSSSITVNTSADLVTSLEQNFVLADPAARRQRIEAGLTAALEGTGLRVRKDEGLLDKLVNLTEYPSVVRGEFDSSYLDLPAEVLVTVMRDHQNYFAVEKADGSLAPMFLAVMNLDRDREGLIRHGHERVLRARFNDARFFWENDRKRTLYSRLEDLKHVTFQERLGSYFEKTERTMRLAEWIAGQWSAAGSAINPKLARSAAQLAKCDLPTDLVKEFTELQGIMGGLYARAEGMDERVSLAIYDQYLPQNVDSAPPRTVEGAAVAIADKLDSVAGLFAIGEIPSGSRDPFALRRQANGIIRTLLAHKLPLSLETALNVALDNYLAHPVPGRSFEPREKTLAVLRDFFREREEFYLREVDGFRYDTVAAVLAVAAAPGQPNDPIDVEARAAALQAARQQAPEQFERVAAALKRMRNIVRKEGGAETWENVACDPARLVEPAEQALYAAIRTALDPGAAKRSYAGELQAISTLWEPLDRFFNEVRVNAEDPALRSNRLALLAWAVKELSRVADFAEIVV